VTWITLAWKFRNEIAIGTIVLVLVIAGLYIKHVFNERTTLETEIVAIKKDLESVKAQVTLNKDIADAIQKIKIQSNNYVRVIETTPSPVVGSSSTVIPSGLFLPTLPTPDTFRNISSSSK